MSENHTDKIFIKIKIPENITMVAGKDVGLASYHACEHEIDCDKMNVLQFPNHVKRIIGSFFTGFFFELIGTMTAGEIREHFSIDINETTEETLAFSKSANEKFMSYLDRLRN